LCPGIRPAFCPMRRPWRRRTAPGSGPKGTRPPGGRCFRPVWTRATRWCGWKPPRPWPPSSASFAGTGWRAPIWPAWARKTSVCGASCGRAPPPEARRQGDGCPAPAGCAAAREHVSSSGRIPLSRENGPGAVRGVRRGRPGGPADMPAKAAANGAKGGAGVDVTLQRQAVRMARLIGTASRQAVAEATLELPAALPDIARVVRVAARPVVTGWEAGDDEVVVQGAVDFVIIYAHEREERAEARDIEAEPGYGLDDDVSAAF